MGERGAGRDRPPRSHWIRRAVLLGSMGAGLWLASNLGHTATAEAAVVSPPCCQLQLGAAPAPVRPEVRTIVQPSVHSTLRPATFPTTDLALPVRTLRIRALPVRQLPVLTRHPVADRSVERDRSA